MEKVDFNDNLNKLTQQLPQGVFLTVKDGEKINTMTIGWALSGRIWNENCLLVAVRYSRHTYEMMENTDEFVVSVPKEGVMKKELSFCGTKSGRDFDKFNECNLTPFYVDESNVPLIKECDLHFVCKKVYQQSMEPSLIGADFIHKKYCDKDYHVMYYGQVISTYKND
ncbi:MAG: flavin reductase family protein [Vallitalea sp.]|jgi:flavin reductase (DIM6/NTAB) family NADH-FMN oxidoreductase RutF|nr:flavin reductase family protein [Vallitalea sp.]